MDETKLKQVLEKAIEISRTNKKIERKLQNEEDRKSIFEAVSKDLASVLEPYIKKMGEHSQMNAEEMRKIIVEAVQVKVPDINTAGIEEVIKKAFAALKIPEPKVTITPPVVNVPAVNLKDLKIPAPQVTVNVPPIIVPEQKVTLPEVLRVMGEMSMPSVDRKNPLPVLMMGLDGKPMNFSSLSGGATGGRGDFFTILGIQNTVGVVTINPDGLPIYSTSSGGASSSSVSLVNADGTYYNSDNPLPITGSISTSPGVQVSGAIDSVNVQMYGGVVVPTGLNETNAGVMRVVLMTDSVTSVNVVSDNITLSDTTDTIGTLQVSGAVDSVNVLTLNGNIPATGLNETTVGVLRTVAMSDTVQSSNIVTFNGNAPATGLNETTTGVLRVVQMTDSIESTNIVTFNGNAPAVGQNETTNGVLRIIQMSDNVNSANVVTIGGNVPTTGSSDTTAGTLRTILMADSITSTQTHSIARQTNPSAAVDGTTVFTSADDLGRQITRPIQARDLIATAYVTVTTGTETTILAATSGVFLDCIWMAFANNSTAAVQVDVRAGTAGSIVNTVYIPAQSTAGWAPPVPWPQDATAATWTADMPDITGTTVAITALFTKEV